MQISVYSQAGWGILKQLSMSKLNYFLFLGIFYCNFYIQLHV